jgi:hypothetical protein
MLSINPKRQVPTLIDGEIALYESTGDLRVSGGKVPGPCPFSKLHPRVFIGVAIKLRQMMTTSGAVWEIQIPHHTVLESSAIHYKNML